MRRIKIPLQDFALKVQGGLMREGGRICGTLRYVFVFQFEYLWNVSILPVCRDTLTILSQ